MLIARGMYKRNIRRVLTDYVRQHHRKAWLVLSDARGDDLRRVAVDRYLRKRKILRNGERCGVNRKLILLCRYLRGHSTYLHVKASTIEDAGKGLFTTRSFEPGEFLCVYSGTKLTLKQARAQRDKTYTMFVGLNCHIDAFGHPDVLARYINDNLTDKSAINARFVKIRQLGVAIVVATRAINSGDEIFAEYGSGYWRAHGK